MTILEIKLLFKICVFHLTKKKFYKSIYMCLIKSKTCLQNFDILTRRLFISI